MELEEYYSNASGNAGKSRRSATEVVYPAVVLEEVVARSKFCEENLKDDQLHSERRPPKESRDAGKREAVFLRELRSFSNPNLLRKFAEQVREAQLGYLKAKRHFAVKTDSGELPICGKLDLELEQWRVRTVDEIIELYRTHSVLSSGDS